MQPTLAAALTSPTSHLASPHLTPHLTPPTSHTPHTSPHLLQVFNISGERFVTFDGIAKACAKAMGAPEPELVHFNPKDFDFGKKKARTTSHALLGGMHSPSERDDDLSDPALSCFTNSPCQSRVHPIRRLARPIRV